jgi:hypothetical protein
MLWNAAFVLKRAAAIAGSYDRNAKAEVLSNLTERFHLCGLIERAASLPRSGATRRRSIGPSVIADAKARFCLAHNVPHPQIWEGMHNPTPQQVQDALLNAAA